MGAGPDLPIETGVPPVAQTESNGDYKERWRTFIGRGRDRLTSPEPANQGSIRYNPNKETE